jgi:ribulose 1,5-bisphosphate synthetase/thiazole synthase
MLFLNHALVVAGLIGRAFSAVEWSNEQWDAIIVGAGPAGIIGSLI